LSLFWWREWLQLKTGTILGFLLIVIFVLAHLFVYIRLKKTVQMFLDNSVPQILTGRFHIIAHSLGSYIVCVALQDEETMNVQRVVLAGCVVDTNFAWPDLLKDQKFAAVRNEVAGRDLVAWAAKFLSWRFPNFGSAGRNGFKEVADHVHTVQSPNQSCATQPDNAHVHNFVSEKKSHSGVLKSTYAKYYWLPFFWGIDPCEFREFLNACFEMMKALANAGLPSEPPPAGDFNRFARTFLTRKWAWAGGSTIPTYLSDAGWFVTPGEEAIIVYNVCLSVAAAEVALGAKVEKWMKDSVARQDYRSAEHDEAIKALNPVTAVKRAFIAYRERSKSS
jgi:pimeloyl-ACP methyl ester carboxylesterase